MSPVTTVCPVLVTQNVEVGTSRMCHQKINIGIDAIQTLQSLEARINSTSNKKSMTDLEFSYVKCYCEFVSISVPNSTRFSVIQSVHSARK